MKLECSVQDCSNPARCRGWCDKHYSRWRTHGDPTVVLARRRVARKDPIDPNLDGKVCSTCNRYLPLNAYYRRAVTPDGLMYRCKDCCRDAYNKRYENDPNFREVRKRHNRSYYDANQERRRRDRRKNLNRYGITEDDFAALDESQGGRCAICNDLPNETNVRSRKKRLCVDHEHETGKIRGLLCDRCNTGLGIFKDSVNRLQSAIAYLQKATQSSSGVLRE